MVFDKVIQWEPKTSAPTKFNTISHIKLHKPVLIYITVRPTVLGEVIFGVKLGTTLYNVTNENFAIAFVVEQKNNWIEEINTVFGDLFIMRYVSTIINGLHMPIGATGCNGIGQCTFCNNCVASQMTKYVKEVVFEQKLFERGDVK